MPDAVQAELARAVGTPATLAWSPEMETLLACARAHVVASAATAKLRPLADPERLLLEAGRHGMTSLLRRWLDVGDLPANFRDTLELRYQANLRHGLRQTAVLVEVMGLLRASGVNALAYKGPALSAQLFGDPALRESVDIDVLLPQNQVTTACERLLAAGFERARRFAPGIEKQLLRYRAETAMVRDGILVELQWRLAPKYFSLAIDVPALTGRAGQVEVAGSELPVLAVEDNLLVLCVHGAKHHWVSLKWLLDIALIIGKNPQLSWETLHERARMLGAERLLRLGLYLASKLLQAPLPETLRATIHQDRVIRGAANELLSALIADHNPTEAEHHRMMLRLRERLTDRALYLLRLGWQPTESEWESVRLPPGMQFAYHGVRMGRVLAKALWGRLG